ncbi:MAG: RdgB/HAM1 family non-canonical purine NTP pyrophosphatase [Vicinamibacterales bacterium]
MRSIVLATSNRDKVREIRYLLRDQPVDLRTLADVPPLPEPDEAGDTFEANARLKALAYAGAISGLVVAEDSGLEIDALGGAPGVRSARFLSPTASYPERFAAIFAQMADVPEARRTARFVCAVAVAEGDRLRFETRGAVEGLITRAPAGGGGFGYDPIFFSPELGCTLAEAGDAKAAVSHRGRAFAALARWLADLK